MNPNQPWKPVVDELMRGRVVVIQDRAAHVVTGRIASSKDIKSIYRVNVRTTPQGVVTWLTKKGAR